MFISLLVPLDQTIEATAALPAALTLARGTGAAITLVRVTSHPGDNSAEARGATEQAEDELRVAAKELAHGDLRINWLVRAAPAAVSIIEAARVGNADVIVMATHGRSGLSRAFAGSVSERVVADSSRPVLLVKSDGKRLDHIATLLVPVDGTAGAVLGLSTAIGLARATGARLILLEVVTPMPMWMYGSEATVGAMAYFDPAWEEEALQSAQTYVAGVGERLHNTGLQVQARTVLGSVADAVVRTSQRPVLLVRRPGASADNKLDEARKPDPEVATSVR